MCFFLGGVLTKWKLGKGRQPLQPGEPELDAGAPGFCWRVCCVKAAVAGLDGALS